MPEKKQDKKEQPKREVFFVEGPSYERFEALTEKLLKVPKEEVDEKRAERKREKKRAE
jgi:hypothetical protein